ncbi:type II CAAX prenyl endopeptidase Rce1 family protein [Melioribacteraceae bacterium 4301-Me]|uniref:CPBP family glutamic-type intramembrane protease n=1 Tax=Pyranulibacter aquaticus TaxID=3163344 RepID=UPI00359B5B8F
MNDSVNNTEPGGDRLKVISSIKPVTAAFLSLLAVFFLYQFGGGLLTIAIFGLNFENADVNAMRLLTMGGQILLILLPALIFARLVYENVTQALRVKVPRFKEIALFAMGLIIITPLLQELIFIQNYLFLKLAHVNSFFGNLKEILDKVDQMVEKTYGNLLSSNSFFESSFVIFVVAVTPAICEETFFRGFVQKSFEQKFKPFWSAVITALFFGLYHFNPYGLVSLVILGIYFGFAAYTSNSIFVSMFLHFLNNSIALTAYFIFGEEEIINTKVELTDKVAPHAINLFALIVIFSFFIYYIKKYYKKTELAR